MVSGAKSKKSKAERKRQRSKQKKGDESSKTVSKHQKISAARGIEVLESIGQEQTFVNSDGMTHRGTILSQPRVTDAKLIEEDQSVQKFGGDDVTSANIPPTLREMNNGDEMADET